jgi:hypothetical protein
VWAIHVLVRSSTPLLYNKRIASDATCLHENYWMSRMSERLCVYVCVS